MSEPVIAATVSKKSRRLAGPIAATVAAGLAAALSLHLFHFSVYRVPQFKKIFADFDTELPGPTMVVVNISDFIASYWFLVVPLIIPLFVGLIVWIWLADWRSGLAAGILLVLAMLICYAGLVLTLFVPLANLIGSARGGGGP